MRFRFHQLLFFCFFHICEIIKCQLISYRRCLDIVSLVPYDMYLTLGQSKRERERESEWTNFGMRRPTPSIVLKIEPFLEFLDDVVNVNGFARGENIRIVVSAILWCLSCFFVLEIHHYAPWEIVLLKIILLWW